MPQAQTYQSEFTGQEMDARFTAVAQLTDALEALTAVVAQKYVKPASGIPSTDMDADVQAALAKANTAVQSLADYYTKSEVDQLLAAINGMDYVDVATLPTASASTLGKIYLVGPDGSGYYAYYYTSYDGSAYSWVGPLGTTQISLANYATKAELNQLDQKVNGQDGPFTDEIVYVAAGKYINGAGTSGTIAAYNSLSLAYVKVSKGVTYQIVFEKECNSAGWLLGYTPVADGTSRVSILQDYGKGNNSPATITLLSTYDGYLAMGYATGYAVPVVTHNGHVAGVAGDVEELANTVDGYQTVENVTVAYDAQGKYISNTNGTIASYASLSLAYYPCVRGRTYHIDWPQTCNSTGYIIGYATAADGSTSVICLSQYGKGTNEVFVLDLISTFTGYLALGYATGAVKPIVKEITITAGLVEKVAALESKDDQFDKIASLKTSIMFFGDSLTSASSVGVDGFAKRIAEQYGIPYRSFALDSADGNGADIPVDYPCFTNYAKDGTKLYIDTDRPGADSVVERIKRHIDASANVDIILVECTINDEAHTDKKGVISDSYTAQYDVYTTLGALEEICRYVSTLGKSFKLGFFIPWQFSWQVSLDYFDDHIAVLNKWGLPYLDLRENAGFNMKGCVAHRIYSLSSDDVNGYDATAEYDTDDLCKYGGEIYKCLSDDVTGVLPTDTEYWAIQPSTGRDGTHLNNIGHEIVKGKIRAFLQSL